ncbi:putative basic proline-rich protein-like [Iris pallida]|uniref:Basic proline-rich protein-like n=1 Tax=Iris pallida TaxID=29817 RepID=A0AAX6G286_IRIPA|nr:putative basic proline-rich protein-like [Iris pallida]KAJ6822632.1 putative basic proline-rich protein-like [Iris pallida]
MAEMYAAARSRLQVAPPGLYTSTPSRPDELPDPHTCLHLRADASAPRTAGAGGVALLRDATHRLTLAEPCISRDRASPSVSHIPILRARANSGVTSSAVVCSFPTNAQTSHAPPIASDNTLFPLSLSLSLSPFSSFFPLLK